MAKTYRVQVIAKAKAAIGLIFQISVSGSMKSKESPVFRQPTALGMQLLHFMRGGLFL